MADSRVAHVNTELNSCYAVKAQAGSCVYHEVDANILTPPIRRIVCEDSTVAYSTVDCRAQAKDETSGEQISVAVISYLEVNFLDTTSVQIFEQATVKHRQSKCHERF